MLGVSEVVVSVEDAASPNLKTTTRQERCLYEGVLTAEGYEMSVATK
ncbi:hypothetical protein PYWP30_02023 [Pyrobaculum sp. WP30]|nr:hypothetical protein PYWP30_02023 [Pyrobaculum sp. WP30]